LYSLPVRPQPTILAPDNNFFRISFRSFRGLYNTPFPPAASTLIIRPLRWTSFPSGFHSFAPLSLCLHAAFFFQMGLSIPFRSSHCQGSTMAHPFFHPAAILDSHFPFFCQIFHVLHLLAPAPLVHIFIPFPYPPGSRLSYDAGRRFFTKFQRLPRLFFFFQRIDPLTRSTRSPLVLSVTS